LNRFVIDTDPGVDDTHALMIAFAHPKAQIEAILTVAGNVSLERTTANACTILDVLEQDIPVFAGCSRPLVAPSPDATHVHGKDGLGDSGYPPSKRKVAKEHAVYALIRMANQSPGELILVTLGPLTNLAIATRLDPMLPKKYHRLVVMGGSIHGVGNVTPTAEFNIYSDPEAAAIVFETWPGLTLISWETTLNHGFTTEQVKRLLAIDSPRAEFFRRITGKRIGLIDKSRGLLVPDGLAVAVALEPDIVQKSEMHHIQVELVGQHTRGQTLVDWLDRSGNKPNVKLVLEMDQNRLWELLFSAVR
jgi:purine nucleosidase